MLKICMFGLGFFFLVLILSPWDSFFILIAHWDSEDPCKNEKKNRSCTWALIRHNQQAGWTK